MPAGAKESLIRWGPGSPMGRGMFGGQTSPSQYTRFDSQRGSIDATARYR